MNFPPPREHTHTIYLAYIEYYITLFSIINCALVCSEIRDGFWRGGKCFESINMVCSGFYDHILWKYYLCKRIPLGGCLHQSVCVFVMSGYCLCIVLFDVVREVLITIIREKRVHDEWHRFVIYELFSIMLTRLLNIQRSVFFVVFWLILCLAFAFNFVLSP